MTNFLHSIVAPASKLLGQVRTEIQLARAVKHPPCRIILGAGGTVQAGWVSTNIEQIDMLRASSWRKYFPENSIDALLAEHVFEHLTPEDADMAARNCYVFLKPGGYIRVAVPDGLHPSREYREAVRPGGSGPGAKDHKQLFTYKTLPQIFEFVGLEVKLLEYHDEKGKFHRKEWSMDDGMVRRSFQHDQRNKDGKPNYTSIILDARKDDAGLYV